LIVSRLIYPYFQQAYLAILAAAVVVEVVCSEDEWFPWPPWPPWPPFPPCPCFSGNPSMRTTNKAIETNIKMQTFFILFWNDFKLLNNYELGSVSQSPVRGPFLVRWIFYFGPQEKKTYTSYQIKWHFIRQNIYLWSAELFSMILWSAKIFFSVLWSAS
jgi:hypothetical protein